MRSDDEGGYLFRPPLDESTGLVFLPGMGGRGGFSGGWLLDRRSPRVSQAVWSHPGVDSTLDSRAASLALALEGRHDLVLMGHSLGCHIALEAAAMVRGNEVAGLILSCQAPPRCTPVFDASTRSDEELAALLEVPRSVAESREAVAAYAALWRQEYDQLNAYLRTHPSTRARVPLVVVGGTRDPASCDPAALAGWGAHTNAGLAVEMVEGGHDLVERLSNAQLTAWCRLVDELGSSSRAAVDHVGHDPRVTPAEVVTS